MKEEATRSKLLTPVQSKLLGITIFVGCTFVLLGFAVLSVQLIGDFLSFFSSVLWPLAVASILAILFKPVVENIERKSGLGPSFSILLLYLLTLIICSVVVWGIGGEVIRQYRDLANTSVDWPERIEGKIKESVNPETWSAVSQKFSQFKNDWKEEVGKLTSGVPEFSKNSAKALQNAWSGIWSFFSVFACLAIVPIYLFYFLESKRDHLAEIIGQLSFLSNSIRADLVYLTHQFKDILEGFFRGQLIIGLMMGIGYAIGFSLAGLKFGIALGLFFGFLNIIPYLGTILGVVSVFAVSYLQKGGILDCGQWSILWGCAFTFALVQIIESYFLSPKVMGKRTGLHPGVIIASVFFWGTAFDGILGMILGIPITAFLIVFWRLLQKKYFNNPLQ